MSDIINTKVTAPYSTSNDLELTPPGAIVVKESGNDNLYALYFSADDLTGTLNGVISCTGNGIETYGINFIDDGHLIFSAGKMAVTVSGNQTAYGLVGSTLELSSAAGVLGGTLNISAESEFTATAAAFECYTELASSVAMTVAVAAAGGGNANATGFDNSVDLYGSFDDKFKLSVTAKAGSGNAQALGAAKKISAAGVLGGAVTIMADAVKGTDAEAVGFNRVSGITDVSDKFKLTVTAKAGSSNATAYGSSSNLQFAGILAGTVKVVAEAVKGNDATACGFSRIDGASTISSKFKYTVSAKAGRGNATAEGTRDVIDVTGIAAGKFNVTADAAKGLSAVAYGAKAISAGTISDNLSFTVKAKSNNDIASAQGLSQQSIVSGVFSGKFTVSAENLAALGAYAHGLSGIQSASVSDKFKLTVSAKSKSSDASATGFDGAMEQQSGPLSGTVTVIATAAGETKAYGATAGVACASVSDKFKLTVSAKSMSNYAIAQGVIGWFSPAGVLSGSIVVMADAAKGNYAEAVGLNNLGSNGRFSDKFVLEVKAQGGYQFASAKGISDSLVASGPVSGSIAILADAAKGTDAGSSFVHSSIIAFNGFSENFELAVAANAGTGDANVFLTPIMTVSRALDGNIALVANATKGKNATAEGVMDSLMGNFVTDDGFAMTVSAQAGTGDATALAFNKTNGSWRLSGTIAVTADAVTGVSANACGFRDVTGISSVSDKFSLSVSAKAGTGAATALGIGVSAMTTFSGTITVMAESDTGIADAVGCKFNFAVSTLLGANCLIVAGAESGGNTATSAGLAGVQGQIIVEGQLVATASGLASSTAYGVRFDQLSSGSAFYGVASAVGNNAVGISGGDGSQLTVTGGVFGGTKGNALSIAKSLHKAVGSYKSALALAKSTDKAIVLGNSSNLSLSAGSVAIGSVTLGSGSTLNLSTGAQLCGDLLMTSGDVNITVDAKLTKAAVVSLSTAGASVFAPASGVTISVTADAGTQTGSYVLLAGSDLSALDGADFNTLYHLSGFDVNNLVASWQLDHGKTDTLTLIVSEKPVTSSLRLGSSLDGAAPLLSASSLTDNLLAAGEGAWSHTTLA